MASNKMDASDSAEPPRLMGFLSLEELLRWVVAGVLAIISWVAVYYPKPVHGFVALMQIERLLFMLTTGVVLGSLIYAVHRSLVHPLTIALLTQILRKTGHVQYECKELLPFWVSKYEQEFQGRWWQRKHGLATGPLREWAAQIHFLYCAAWALLLIRLFGSHFMLALYGRVQASPSLECLLAPSALCLALIAFYSNLRMIDMEAKLAAMDNEAEQALANKGGRM